MVVSLLREVQNHIVGRGRIANDLVWEKKLAKLLRVVCGFEVGFPKPLRHWVRIRVESSRIFCIPGPEPETAHLVRIRLPRDCVWQMRNATGMQGRRAPGKTCHGKIEASPEEMHWTALTAETRSEAFENAVSLR